MHRYLLLLVPVFFTISCSREAVVIPQSAVDAKVDSIVAHRRERVLKAAADDLEQRRTIEVKVKTDSIIQARTSGPPPAP